MDPMKKPMTERRKRNMISPPTRAYISESRKAPEFTLWKLIHGYVYARWTYIYISAGRGNHWLAKVFGPAVRWMSGLFPGKNSMEDPLASGTFADGYHGKVMPLDAAKSLISVQQDIQLCDLEKVIPYPRARDIILRNPDHIVALECPCRAGVEDPCLPMDVCLIVGDPMAGMVRQFHPDRSRQITREEAAAILEAEHERGHVHHAFFKDAVLGRYYAICNCCSCCCGAMHAHQNGTPMLASSGYEVSVQEELCSGCEQCVEMCPFDVLSVPGGTVAAELEKCMGCGVCVSNCAQGALSLVRNPVRGEPLEIGELIGM